MDRKLNPVTGFDTLLPRVFPLETLSSARHLLLSFYIVTSCEYLFTSRSLVSSFSFREIYVLLL
jgi:hypothetical protein